MDIFINECSLHGQYFDIAAFERGIRLIFSLVQELQQIKFNQGMMLYADKEGIKQFKVIKSQSFISSLNALPDKSLRQAFIGLLFNQLNAQDWHADQQHVSSDLFTCNDELVTDTCLAEAAERKLIQADFFIGLLLNFYQSKYADLVQLKIIKNEAIQPILIDCADNKNTLQKWLEAIFNLSRYRYDYMARTSPTDEQTVLRDTTLFKLSSLPPYDGRKVYQEVQTNRYWYVDNLHYGHATHLEVFDLQGRHIGEASLDGKLDLTKQDPRKRLST